MTRSRTPSGKQPGKKRNTTYRKPNRWQRSEAWRQIGRKAITEFNAVTRHERPKCGAHSKTTGEPCRQLAMANGRCAYHGGRTPSGDLWHIQQMPAQATPKTIARTKRKMKRAVADASARKKRIAGMPPEEQEWAREWDRTHRPGSASQLRRRREWRRQADDARESIERAGQPKPPSPEVQRIEEEIGRLKALLAAATAPADQDQPADTPDLGVFG